MIGSKFQRRILPLDCFQCRHFNSFNNRGHVICKRCWKWSNHNVTGREARSWKRQHVCKREGLHNINPKSLPN